MELNDREREQVRGIQRRADRNSHKHIAHALRLSFLDNIAKFTATLGGALVMVASAILLSISERYLLLEIIVAVLGGIITLIGLWEAVWHPGERARRHKEWSQQFARIEEDCRLFLAGNGSSLPELARAILKVSAAADLIPEHHWRRVRKGKVSETDIPED